MNPYAETFAYLALFASLYISMRAVHSSRRRRPRHRADHKSTAVDTTTKENTDD